MRCKFPALAKDTECSNCGYRLRRDYPVAPIRICGPPDEFGLGDLAETFLSTLGITKERYSAIKAKIGLDPNCGCDARQEAWNKIGEEIGVNDLIGKFSRWMWKPNAAESAGSAGEVSPE